MEFENMVSVVGLVGIAIFSQVYGSFLSVIKMEKDIKHIRKRIEYKKSINAELGNGGEGNRDQSTYEDDEEENTNYFMRIDKKTALMLPAVASVSLLLFYYLFNTMSFVVSLWVLVFISQAIAYATKPFVYKYIPVVKKMRIPVSNKKFFNTQILCCMGVDESDDSDLNLNAPVITSQSNGSAGAGSGNGGILASVNGKKGKGAHVFSVFIHLASFVVLLLYLFTGNTFLSNLIGVSFCVMMISMINLKNFKIGSILLTGLFLYDIFWVYFSGYFFTNIENTNVMENVAMKSSKNPIYVLAQVVGSSSAREGGLTTANAYHFIETLQLPNKLVWNHSILGLGDIVLPGLVVAFLKKYDTLKGKSYWLTGVIGYSVGLVMAVIAGIWTGSGQPALLFIVPSLILPVIVGSLVRNEFWDLWNTELKLVRYIDCQSDCNQAKNDSKIN